MFAWRNGIPLQANPIALGLVVLVPLAVLGGRGRSAGLTLAALLAGRSALGLLLYTLTPQASLPFIAFGLPVHLGLFFGLREVRHPATERPEP